MSPRSATFLVFVLNGAMIGTWLAGLPQIAGQLGVTKTEIGLALLASALGGVVAMTITGQALTRTTSRRLVTLLVVLFPLAAPIPAWAPSLGVLALGMVVFGALNGVLDVAMNAHGVALEKGLGRPIISSLHAGWSLGGLLGAAGVALAAAIGLDLGSWAVVTTVILLGVAAVAIPNLGAGSLGAADHAIGGTARLTARFSLPARAVLPVGLLAIVAALVEGGISDWFGLYLERDLGVEPGMAALGFAAFAGGMTVGRLAGDPLHRRSGAGPLVRDGFALVAVALAVTLALGQPLAALVGVAVAGAGIANAIPLVFRAGGHIQPSGPSLAAVFTMTYGAFLVAPPVLGFVADGIGLPLTLWLIVGVAALAALLTTRVPGFDGTARSADPHAARARAG